MKFIKQTLLTILMLITAGLLFRGWCYRHLVTYKSVGLRTNYSATEKELIDYIETNINKQSTHDIKEVIKLGLSITSAHLNYTISKNDIDPNKLVYSKTAHCVGYSSFFATICNYLLKKYNLSNEWIAKPQIGQIYFLGTNIHQYCKSSFYKDHDFVTMENKKTGEIIAIDPTIHDYLRIDFITYRK
jgi:hypothetical protein